MRCSWLIPLSLCVLACGPKSRTDLQHPTYGMDTEDGVCGNQIIVDGAHHLWTEHGCEGNSTGLQQQRTLSNDEWEQVTSAFDALPRPPPACDSTQQPDSGMSQSPSRTTLSFDSATASLTWQQCPNGTPGFADAQKAMNGLVTQ